MESFSEANNQQHNYFIERDYISKYNKNLAVETGRNKCFYVFQLLGNIFLFNGMHKICKFSFFHSH